MDQFRRIKEARLKMGHFPITHMAINPSSTGSHDFIDIIFCQHFALCRRFHKKNPKAKVVKKFKFLSPKDIRIFIRRAKERLDATRAS